MSGTHSRVWLSKSFSVSTSTVAPANTLMPPHLVTGTSSGFGLAMARYALANGDRVVATLRKPEILADFAAQYSPEQLLVLRLDVSQAHEIKQAFAKAKAVFGRVDVVFNNAGRGVLGEAEAMPDDLARGMFEVNFWGAAHVSQEAVRFFRDENRPQGGHLIQNSAAAGLNYYPMLGHYTAAKHGQCRPKIQPIAPTDILCWPSLGRIYGDVAARVKSCMEH